MSSLKTSLLSPNLKEVRKRTLRYLGKKLRDQQELRMEMAPGQCWKSKEKQ